MGKDGVATLAAARVHDTDSGVTDRASCGLIVCARSIRTNDCETWPITADIATNALQVNAM